ncbi:MAG: YggS family pyridoxal phosphate-dependent enzyme [Pseudomonadota bacterium]|nr:MAG: YggS family pyridoxal phosphate-dependent enzyme [Pseudomonadota bacterium]
MVRERIAVAEARAGRPPGSVAMLAVSKTWPMVNIEAALQAGQHRFGESYLQEALAKIETLAGRGIEWHFVGPIQSNKTRPIAAHFDWVHSVARLKIAERLSAQRLGTSPPLNVCLQVNLSGEHSKSGTRPQDTLALAQAVAQLPRLRLRGLMVVPAREPDPARQRAPFRALHDLLEELNAAGLALDTLSMGMTDDLEAAIAEGATIVRVGTGIFGPRPRN